MDIVSLLVTSIPAYFVAAPLVIVLIVLVALIMGTKNSPTIAIATPNVATSYIPPYVTAAPPQAPPPPSPIQSPQPFKITQTPTPSFVPASAPAQVPLSTSASVPQSSVSMQSTSAQPVMQKEIYMQAPTPTASPMVQTARPLSGASPVPFAQSTPQVTPAYVSQGVIPPISSWKPAEPKAISSENLGQSEAQLQSQASTNISSGTQADVETPLAKPLTTGEAMASPVTVVTSTAPSLTESAPSLIATSQTEASTSAQAV